MWYNYTMMGSCRLFPLLMLVIIGLIIYALFFRSKLKVKSDNSASALHILKQRYARGEISKDEFGTMKRELL